MAFGTIAGDAPVSLLGEILATLHNVLNHLIEPAVVIGEGDSGFKELGLDDCAGADGNDPASADVLRKTREIELKAAP